MKQTFPQTTATLCPSYHEADVPKDRSNITPYHETDGLAASNQHLGSAPLAFGHRGGRATGDPQGTVSHVRS